MNWLEVVVCIGGKFGVLYIFVPSLQHKKEVPKIYFIQVFTLHRVVDSDTDKK